MYKQIVNHVMQGNLTAGVTMRVPEVCEPNVSFQKSQGHTETTRNSITYITESSKKIFSQRRSFYRLKNPHNITHTCWWYKLCVVWLWCISSKYNTKTSSSRLNIFKMTNMTDSKVMLWGEGNKSMLGENVEVKLSQPRPQKRQRQAAEVTHHSRWPEDLCGASSSAGERSL